MRSREVKIQLPSPETADMFSGSSAFDIIHRISLRGIHPTFDFDRYDSTFIAGKSRPQCVSLLSLQSVVARYLSPHMSYTDAS